MSNNHSNDDIDVKKHEGMTRRNFIKLSTGAVACASFSSLLGGCNNNGNSAQLAEYPIDSTVVKTTHRMITFPYYFPTKTLKPGQWPITPDPINSPNGENALTWPELRQVSDYDELGYGQWAYLNQPLHIVARTDIMANPDDYDTASVAPITKLVNFVAMTDIHLTDKEAPNQLTYIPKGNPGFAGQNTSIYSGILPYTPHVFDAAIQTANALHKENPFDFFISLGDVTNTSMYKELRWYLDIIDGKNITPSSGAHLGADTVDYQKPFKAAGLDKSIPFYQTLGNHDHFYLGSFPIFESGLEDYYTSDTVWSVPNELLTPKFSSWPALFDKNIMTDSSKVHYYQGVIDGTSEEGAVIYAGDYVTAPKIVADPERRALHRSEFIEEFFKTTSNPIGHGFNLVSSNPNFHLVPESDQAGFACYSFLPKSDVPLKIIVLDNTQREDDDSNDIHGHGFLDEARWAWLQAELDDGQAANQLMIIAAHIPIAVAPIGSELEWWLGDDSANTTNAVNITDLVLKLQSSTNLLMWISGHRHFNHVKAFKPNGTVNEPENGFWQVETSSLHDFPQQFRTFEIFLNNDYTVSIEAVNVDPAFAEGTPAAKSRKNAIAAQQIVHQNLMLNPANIEEFNGTTIPPMDPTRPQDGSTDPSIQWTDLISQGIPYNASYNARLFKQLSPTMKAHLEDLFPVL